MSYDPPTGQELNLTRFAERVFKRLEKSRPGRPPYMFGHDGHALEGVRVNGWERLTSVIDCVDELEDHSRALSEYVETIQKRAVAVRVELVALQSEMTKRGLKPCPACRLEKYDDSRHGRQMKGVKDKIPNAPGGTPNQQWTDCETCDGRGLVKIT